MVPVQHNYTLRSVPPWALSCVSYAYSYSWPGFCEQPLLAFSRVMEAGLLIQRVGRKKPSALMSSGWELEMGKDVGRGMLPAIQMLVSQRAEGSLGGSLPCSLDYLFSIDLATFLWGGLCALHRDRSSFPDSSGKMSMAIPRSCHILRDRQGTGPHPSLPF